MADLQSAALATWLRSRARLCRLTGFSGVSPLGQDGSYFDANDPLLEETQ